MMKKNAKQIFLGLIFVMSIGLTIYSIIFEIESKWLELLFTLAPILVFYGQNIIENFDSAFIFWNKCKVWLKNPPLEWKKTVTLEYSESIEQGDLNNLFSKILTENDYSTLVAEKPVKLPTAANRFKMKFGITTIDMVILPENTLKLECYSKINYRQSKVEINKIFDYLLKKVLQHIQKGEIKENYSLKIKFANENPFYGLYVSKIELSGEVNFLLKYSLDEINYLVSNRTIEATTTIKEKLDKVSNDFLILAES